MPSRGCALALLAAQLSAVYGQEIHHAVAIIRASEGQTAPVEGTVRFEQTCFTTPCLSEVKVTVDIKNLSPGTHGFHVHQFGDTRSTSDLSTMSAHFVPQCIPPDIPGDDPCHDDPAIDCFLNDPCKNDMVHGLPPSQIRQPGDMGNIVIGADGRITNFLGAGGVDISSPPGSTTTFSLGQQKLSLSDRLKSIIGRTVVIHNNTDTGEPPYGEAGPPIAYGIIGIANPPTGLLNNAQAPRIPTVDQVICTFEKAPIGLPEARISGFALLTLQEPDRPNIVRMQAVLDGFQVSSQAHSFHFHTWGDMSVDMQTGLGPIYQSEGIEVHELEVNSKGQGVFDEEFEATGLLQHVGRSLTIHEGPDRSTPTIAAAACGLAYPGARLDTGVSKSSSSGLSTGAVVAISFTVVGVVAVVGMLALFWFRLPIPFCGKCVYGGNGNPEFVEVGPPPPPPKGRAPPGITTATEAV